MFSISNEMIVIIKYKKNTLDFVNNLNNSLWIEL